MGDFNRRDFLAWAAKGTFGVAVAGGTLLSANASAASGAGITVLVRATVIDGTGAKPIQNCTIVLADDRILAVGRHPEVPRLEGIRVVDLAGKYVVPGLWDLHTHQTFFETTIPQLHVVNGVTGIRDMWGYSYTHDTRQRIEDGTLLGPRMVIASAVIDGPGGIWDDADIVDTPADGRAAVHRAISGGADFAKVYSFLSPGVYAAIAAEADAVGLPFAGHVPARVSVQDAVEAGQHTHEHMYNLFTSTSDDAEALYARLNDPADPTWWRQNAQRVEREAVATHDPARAEALFGRMVAKNIWQSPTLLVERQMSLSPEDIEADPAHLALMRYIPVDLRALWSIIMDPRPPRTPEEVARLLEFADARLRLLGTMHEAGVGIVAGTDAGFPYIFPGTALHRELELLVSAGLSPMAALQAATRNAARSVGLGHESGTISVGKRADLVVLDADPLADIANIRKIHAVVARGQYLSPADRTRIFAEIEAAAEIPSEDGRTIPAGGCLH